jgi:low affinity Fe/Cu permease
VTDVSATRSQASRDVSTNQRFHPSKRRHDRLIGRQRSVGEEADAVSVVDDPGRGPSFRYALVMNHRQIFSGFSRLVARATGHPAAFWTSFSVIAVWGLTGPIFHYSDTWQLVINTSTTIVTFLMVFLIQNTQNRDSAAIQVKLDELIRCVEGAHNALLDLEEMTQEDLDKIRRQYESLATRARKELRAGAPDTGRWELEEEA